MNKPEKIIVHHTAVSRLKAKSQFYAVDKYHRSLWGEAVRSSLGYYGGYHLFIEPSGAILRYRNDDEDGAHTIGENQRSIGICMTGNFDVEHPTMEQTRALTDTLRTLCVRHGISTTAIYPHRKFAKKSCYGNLLSDTWASELASHPTTTDERHEIELLAKVSMFDLPREVLLRIVRAIIKSRK